MPTSSARFAAAANAATTRAMPASSSAAGVCHPASNGIALGAKIGDHPPPSTPSGPPPSHGRTTLALRPACASCDPNTAPCARTNRPMRASISMCVVAPQAEVLRADSTLGNDRRRLGEHERRAADRELSEVDEVPVVGESVDARVLAHRRHADAVAERHAAEREGFEEGSCHKPRSGEKGTASGCAATPRPVGLRMPKMPHAVVMMLLIIVAAVALTYVVPSGTYERTPAGLVVPGTFHTVPKEFASRARRRERGNVARPASPVAIVSSIPVGHGSLGARSSS